MKGIVVAIAVGAAFGIFGFTAAMGITGSFPVAAIAAVVSAGVAGLLAYTRLSLDPSATSRGLSIVSAVATLAALVVFARLAVFMVDERQAAYSGVPNSTWEVGHSCVSAYFVAARASSHSSDIYADSLYTARDDDPAKPRKPLTLGSFKIDVFEYPPPFLLLPRALRALAPEFASFRPLWFGLNGAVVLIAMIAVTRLLGPAPGTRALMLLPLAWFALPMISNMQKGNAQALVIATSMLAMLLFERRRWAAGGTLLAFAVVSKLYPGLLVVYLIARREWRAVAWTSVMALGFVIVAALDIGAGSYAAFREHLPGLLSGQAFPAFRNPMAVAANFSIPGLVFKLKLFGVQGMSFEAAKLVGWVYTLVAAAATVVLALRIRSAEDRPLAWLTVLILATLRSPFLPQGYAAVPGLWLLTLMAARRAPTVKVLAWTVAAWAILGFVWPIDWALDPRLLAILSGLPQSAMILMAAWLVRQGLRDNLADSRGSIAYP